MVECSTAQTYILFCGTSDLPGMSTNAGKYGECVYILMVMHKPRILDVGGWR